MPATFDAFGLRFMYPDNWKVSSREDDEGERGLTLELPSGGFFSIEIDDESLTDGESIQRASDAILAEYPDAEKEVISDAPDQLASEFQFFYLDMLIISRLLVLNCDEERLLIQIQAESREFEKNAMVFEAILKQIRDAA